MESLRSVVLALGVASGLVYVVLLAFGALGVVGAASKVVDVLDRWATARDEAAGVPGHPDEPDSGLGLFAAGGATRQPEEHRGF